MQNFVYDIPTKIYFGKGQLENLGPVVKSYGQKILLVYGGGSIKKTGLYEQVIQALKAENIEIFELSGVEPNPKIDSVRQGTQICKENNIEAVLAVGGGSVLDCAKYITASALYDGEPWDLIDQKLPVPQALPLITIVTMAATGSEMDTGAVISNPEVKEKLCLMRPSMRPVASFLDPTLTYSVSTYQTACGCADIFSHAAETYFNDGGMYMLDKFYEGIMNTVVQYGPVALEQPENYEARANIMWAASWAINGIARITQPYSWSCHPLEHELSAFYDITHGLGLAILTPRWMEFVVKNKGASPKLYEMGKGVFSIPANLSAEEGAQATIEATKDFLHNKLGIQSSLTEIGIGEEHIPEMAKKAVKNGLCRAFYPLTEEECAEIYRACL